VLRRVTETLHWLRSHEQSLFRRDQLRQLLTLLRDDDRSLYLETLRGILFGTGIRFHLQHLVIRLLGTWDVLLDGEVDVLVELYGLLDWHEHVVREAICVNRGVFSAFCLRGVFQAQLTSGDETQLLAALRVMRWVSATFGDAVERLLEPYWTVGGVWPAWICSVLPFSADADTDRMFEFRVSQIEAGVTFQGMDFFSEQWARSAPVRCIRIAHVLISGYLSKCRADLEEAHVGEIPNWPFRDDWRDKALEIACDAAPRDAWEQFLPCATLLSSLHRIGRRGVQPYWRGSERYREMARAGTFIRRLLVASGKKLAEICPDEFEQFVAPCLKTKSLTIRRVLLASFAAGGGRLADQAIGWLCDRPKLFRAGSQYDDSRWQPAYRVIQHLSSLCSDDIYRRLEETILRYREPNEIESCRRKLRRAKDGFLTINDVGRAQNTLLCALPVSRMSSAARAIAGVWQVKFGPHLFKKREPSKFRAVVSPIPRDRLHLVSDRQWLRIIRRQWPERCWTDRDAGKDLITEASTSTFAADFAEMAKRQPQRFAALALRIPSDADPAYLSRVLGNLITSVPPVPGSPDVGKWKPATQEQLEALLNVVGYSSDYGQATGFCDIIDRRCTATWSNAIFERLARYALIHPDPAFESAQRDLPMTEINCVRGRAAHAISRLVFEKPELSTRFLPAIEGLTRDPHPAVRLAAVQACLSLLNVDRALATRLFMQSCDVEDDRICAGHSVHEFVRYARFSHWETMIPLIERMVHSAHSEAAEEGALWVTVNWLESGLMSNLATACLSGSIAQRKGLAKAAVGLADGERTRERCLDLLMRLFDDDSEDRSARGEIHLPSP